MKDYRVCLLPGDGIGPEVIGAAQRVLEALPLRFTWVAGEIGFGAYQRLGTPLPDETLANDPAGGRDPVWRGDHPAGYPRLLLAGAPHAPGIGPVRQPPPVPLDPAPDLPAGDRPADRAREHRRPVLGASSGWKRAATARSARW